MREGEKKREGERISRLLLSGCECVHVSLSL